MPQVPYTDAAEWWHLCADVNAACCATIAQDVASARMRAQFSRALVWSDYDALMLGRFDSARLSAVCFEAMQQCTKRRAVGWCRKIAAQVASAATAGLHAFLAERADRIERTELFEGSAFGPHFCSARTACACAEHMCTQMQARVTSVLVAAAFQKLMTTSFVYTHDRILWPRCLVADVTTAVCMARHTRLGAASPLMLVDCDILELIMSLSGIEPQGRKGRPAGSRTCAAEGDVACIWSA